MIIPINREENRLAKGFDILKFFEEKEISFKTAGENIGRGWIGIQTCPFCGKDGFHYGIHIDTKRSSCWVCGSRIASKNIHFLVHKVAKCSISQAKSFVLQYQDAKSVISKDMAIAYATECRLPKHIYPDPPKKMLTYLESRGFDKPEELAAKYGLKMSMPHCSRPNSLIMPYFYEGELITYVSRGIIGKGYKTAPIRDSVIDAKRAIYNIDNCKPRSPILVVEGPMDVLKVGFWAETTDQVCGTNGTQWTYEQLMMILSKRPSHVFLCYDSLEEDAQKQAQKMVDSLIYLGVPASRIELSQEKQIDPGSLTKDEVKILRDMVKID